MPNHEVRKVEQRIEDLTQEDAEEIEAKRKWVREHYSPESRHKYQSLEGKLVLLDTILKNKWIDPTETLKLQCLGIAFGDALAQKLGLKWVAVEDENGRDPALSVEGTSLLVFPMTSILKRIERGEDVDINDLFNIACEKLTELKSQWA
jgi:hypothetical protein